MRNDRVVRATAFRSRLDQDQAAAGRRLRHGHFFGRWLASRQHLKVLTHLDDARRRQDAAKIRSGINDAIAAQNGAGIDHRIAADLRPITDNRAEFLQAGGDAAISRAHVNLAVIEFHIRENHARAEMRAVTENRIADVIEMRHLRFIEEDAVLEFARVPHHHAVADDHIFAHVTTAADLAVRRRSRPAL